MSAQAGRLGGATRERHAPGARRSDPAPPAGSGRGGALPPRHGPHALAVASAAGGREMAPGSFAAPNVRRAGAAGGDAVRAVARQRRGRPWWVLGVGFASLIGWSGWVAAQPLPPVQTTPALKAAEATLKRDQAVLGSLQSQSSYWSTQRQQAAQALQQEEAIVAQLTGQAQPGVGNLPSVGSASPAITMTGGS